MEESLNNSFSTRGFIMGYSSGVFLLLVSVPVVLLMSRSVQVPFECEEYKTIETDATPGYRYIDDYNTVGYKYDSINLFVH